MVHNELRVAEFAFPGPLRDQLVAAIVAGAKTTTTGLLADYEHEGEALPLPGQREVVIDSAGQPVTVTEIVAVRVLRLADVDLAHALGEGEGYTSVAQWRAGHEEYWHSRQMREALEDPDFTVDDDTQVVAVEFRVIGREDAATAGTAATGATAAKEVTAAKGAPATPAPATAGTGPTATSATTAERNKRLVIRLIDEVWNGGELRLLTELWSGPSRDEAYSSHKILTGAFPDLRVEIEDLIAEGDRVAARLSLRGTHLGPFRGIAPTGRQVHFTAIRVYQITDGTIVGSWANQDALGLLRQLQIDAAH